MVRFLTALSIFLFCNNFYAQSEYSKIDSLFPDYNLQINKSDIAHVKWERVAAIGGSVAVLNAGLWIYYDKAWYKGEKTKWHAYNDWYNGNLNIDKFGHFHWAIVQNRIFYRAFKWANISDNYAMWTSSALGWLLHLQIEMNDAYFKEWGFSWGDLGANTLGAVYPNFQRIYSPLKAVNLKVSYYPSDNYKRGLTKHAVNDYEGRKYWMTLNMRSVAPKQIQKYLPDWLNIAIGYGGDNIVDETGHLRQIDNVGIGDQEWFISFDYDLLKIFKPKENTFFYLLLEQLDAIHFPAPAIKIKPNVVWFGLYF